MTKLKEALKGKIPYKLLGILPSSYDIIGDVLIFSELPNKLSKHEKIISKMIFSLHKNIKVIVKKTKKYSGKYRLPKFKIIAGEKRLETEFKENGCIFKINLEKSYFSPRLSEERKRIFSQIKPNEKVLVMFSGTGVYPITIAKNSKPKEVYAVELNKDAHKYAKINVGLNKIKNVKLFCGDIRKVVPNFKIKFDRIIMPLPKGAATYLDIALKKIKKNGIIHFYYFEEEKKFNKIIKKIEKYSQSAKKSFRILNIRKCGQYAPRVFRGCVDFEAR